jgi:maltooligosyltrehalose synthase
MKYVSSAGPTRDLLEKPTPTHDTKRSEDARARIKVLSEIPHEWNERLARWANLNAKYKERVGS